MTIENQTGAARAPVALPLVAGGLMLVAVIAAGMNILILIGVLAMAPVSLLWLRGPATSTPGVYGLDGPLARWALVLALPALSGLMMASRVQALAAGSAWVALAAGIVLCAAVLAFARVNPLAQPLGALFALAVSVAFADAAVVGLDVALDHGAPRVEAARVIELSGSSGGRSARWQVTLAGPFGERGYAVAPAVYQRLHVGGPACILHHPGALGFAWAEVSECG